MPIYEGNCQKCGKFGRELLKFKGVILCWPCITEGRKPVESLSANEIKDLIRMGHPYERGQPYSRMEVMEEIERRGPSLLEELGWPTEMEALYRNRYVGEERTLYKCLNPNEEYGESPEVRAERRGEGWWHDLFSVIEYNDPAVGQNLTRPEHLAEKRGCRALDEFFSP